MLKVVSFKICPFVQRVTALLEAKEIPYEIEYISLSQKPQWFLDISPNAQVPLLITESGTPLFESDAIIEYLEEAYPALEEKVTLEQKALDRAWSYLGAKNYLVQCSTMRSADQLTLEERSAKLNQAFSKIEAALTGSKFFKGDKISNVDIAWLPILHRASIIKERACYDFLSAYPKVKAWQQALLETGLPRKSVSEDFEDMFSDFYLSDKTFLGSGKDCTFDPDTQCGSSQCCA